MKIEGAFEAHALSQQLKTHKGRLMCDDPFIAYLKTDSAMNDLNNHYQSLTTINSVEYFIAAHSVPFKKKT